jgi:tetratricopeptide (TPR) repeat protein
LTASAAPSGLLRAPPGAMTGLARAAGGLRRARGGGRVDGEAETAQLEWYDESAPGCRPRARRASSPAPRTPRPRAAPREGGAGVSGRGGRGSSLARLATSKLLAREEEEARALLERALALGPGNPGVLTARAQMLHQREREVKAGEELLERALTAAPLHADALCALGGILLDDSRKDYARAETLFLRCLAVQPRHVTALAFYGLYVQARP